MTIPGGHAESSENSSLLKHLAAAGKMLRAKQLDAAANELSAAVTADFGKLEAGYVMGMILLEEDRAEEAGQVYSEILEQDPDFPEVHTRLCATSLRSGDPESALREAKAAGAPNPNNPVAHLNAGIVLVQMRNFDAAKAEFQASMRSKPDYALAYVSLGSLLDDLHDFNGAAEQYKKALTLNPNDPNVHYNLGIAYGNKGDYASAIREYREAPEARFSGSAPEPRRGSHPHRPSCGGYRIPRAFRPRAGLAGLSRLPGKRADEHRPT
jgi:tetratricopeptide (TPR) repeat protein